MAGAPNLHLFNIIYFVVVTVDIVPGIAFYCFLSSQIEYKEYLMFLAFSIQDFWITIFLERKKKKYVTHHCLNQTTFAAVGGRYPRNIFSGKETRNYLFCVQIILMVDALNEMFPMGSLSHKIVHGVILIFWVSLFAIYIPVKHYLHSREYFPEIFQEEKKSTRRVFYMTKPAVLIPRQPCNISMIKQHYQTGQRIESLPQQGSSILMETRLPFKKNVTCAKKENKERIECLPLQGSSVLVEKRLPFERNVTCAKKENEERIECLPQQVSSALVETNLPFKRNVVTCPKKENKERIECLPHQGSSILLGTRQHQNHLSTNVSRNLCDIEI